MFKVFTVFDSKVMAYGKPVFDVSLGSVVRSITEVVNCDKDHPFFKYPADFTLFELGNFDEFNGIFTLYPTPISLGVLIEFKEAAGSIQ